MFQFESGSNGTHHAQGYAEFSAPLTMNQVKSILTRAHWERRMGTREQARDYCMKDDTRMAGPWEYGTFESNQGKRSDLQAAARVAIETHSVQAIIDHDPSLYVKYSKGFDNLLFHTMPKRTKPPKIILYYGKTGTGKTRKAYHDHPDLYRKPPDNTWFCGYYGQKVLLLDDFAGAASKMALVFLLQLLDRYPVLLPIKGSHSQLLAETIIITTNVHPFKWYDYSERLTQYDALARRIHEVWWFKDLDGVPWYIDKDSFFVQWMPGCNENITFKNITRPNTPFESEEEEEETQEYIVID